MREFEQYEIEWLTEAGVEIHEDIPADLQRSLYGDDILKFGPYADRVLALSSSIMNSYLADTQSTKKELEYLYDITASLKVSSRAPASAEDSTSALLFENIDELSRTLLQPFNPSYDRDSLLKTARQREAVISMLWFAAGRTQLSAHQIARWDTLLQNASTMWVPLDASVDSSVEA